MKTFLKVSAFLIFSTKAQDILQGSGIFNSATFFNEFTGENEPIFSDTRWQFVYPIQAR